MKLTLPGQMDLPECPERLGQVLQAKANAALKPAKPQQPCNHGLFSDEAAQIDLIEMLQDPV